MSLANHQKDKFKILHSKYTKVLNLIENIGIDSSDQVAIDLIKLINESMESLIIDVDDLRNYLKTKTNPNNNYYKEKTEEFKERHIKLKQILPYLLLL
jgi:hypothetical protein